MIARRHLRVRVLEALERRVKQFVSREELWPLRVPGEPVPIEDVIAEALPEDHRDFDPIVLRSRTLLHLEWGPRIGEWPQNNPEQQGHGPADIPLWSTWKLWVIVLPSGVKVYCDSGEEETRILASGGRNEGDASDRAFLELLAQSGGAHFGIEMSGGAPMRVRSSIDDRELLIGLFVDLFEVSGTEGSIPRIQSGSEGTDLRADVELWLGGALRRGK